MTDPRTSRRKTATLALATAVALMVGGGEAESGAPTVEKLRSPVDGFAHAIETNNRELALWYVHPRSPRTSEIDAALRDQLASYMERARTSHLERLRLPEGTSSARVDQEIVRVFGMKFTRGTRRSIYHLRELGESWRIWAIDDVAIR